jgi:hypothetical protein
MGWIGRGHFPMYRPVVIMDGAVTLTSLRKASVSVRQEKSGYVRCHANCSALSGRRKHAERAATVSNSLKATLIEATAEGGSNPRHCQVIHHAAWRK